MGITAVAVQATTGSIQTLNHSSGLERLQILINGCMSDASTSGIELFENVARAEVTFFSPEQIQNHAPLTAQTHPQIAALFENIIETSGGGDVHFGSGVAP